MRSFRACALTVWEHATLTILVMMMQVEEKAEVGTVVVFFFVVVVMAMMLAMPLKVVADTFACCRKCSTDGSPASRCTLDDFQDRPLSVILVLR